MDFGDLTPVEHAVRPPRRPFAPAAMARSLATDQARKGGLKANAM